MVMAKHTLHSSLLTPSHHRTPMANLQRWWTRHGGLRPSICRRWKLALFVLVPLLLFLTHLLPASELNRSPTAEVRSVARRRRPNRLIFGPSAGHGVPGRVHCQGLRAINMAHLGSSAQISKHNEKVSLVTVFALYNNTTPSAVAGNGQINSAIRSDTVIVGRMPYNRTEISMAILNTYIDFIKMSMPTSNVFILTDPASKFLLDRENAIVNPIQGYYSREQLMLQRMRSYIAFLEKRLEEHLSRPTEVNHYIFTDTDIAVVDDLGHIFQDYPQFHVALTFRNNKEQPLNSGFIAVRGNADGILKAKLFLQGVLDVYISRFMRASGMLGDQLALAWLVKSDPSFDATKFGKPKAFLSEIKGTSVLFLPCLLYNWTPPEGAGQFHGMPMDVKVIHFKGSRKRLMLESWNFFKTSASLHDMMCLILMSGRTKYDF